MSDFPVEPLGHPANGSDRQPYPKPCITLRGFDSEIPHAGEHFAGPSVFAMSGGELRACRYDGDYPFLLLAHHLAIPGVAPWQLFTIVAQFLPWSALSSPQQKNLRYLPTPPWKAILVDHGGSGWIALHEQLPITEKSEAPTPEDSGWPDTKVHLHAEFTAVEVQPQGHRWFLVQKIRKQKCTQPLYVNADHIASKYTSITADDKIWTGKLRVRKGALLAHGDSIHVECLLATDLRHLACPRLLDLLGMKDKWAQFQKIIADSCCMGWNEWSGPSSEVVARYPSAQQEEIRSCLEKACWCTEDLLGKVKMPSPGQTLHVSPGQLASAWNQLVDNLHLRGNKNTDLPGDLQEFGAAMRLLIFELLAVGANCNGEESPVIFRSILARAQGAQFDWKACQGSLRRLLQLSPCTDKSPMSAEKWLAPGVFDDAHLRQFLQDFRSGEKFPARLWHRTDQPLPAHWNIQALQSDRSGQPMAKQHGAIKCYTVSPKFECYTIRPWPQLKANAWGGLPAATVRIKCNAWNNLPSGTPPPSIANWLVVHGHETLQTQQGGDSIDVVLPKRTKPAVVSVIALSGHGGHLSHGQCGLIVYDKPSPITDTDCKQFIERCQKAPTLLVSTLVKLGYWANGDPQCASALTTLQYERNLDTHGLLDLITARTILETEMTPEANSTLRGRPGIPVEIPVPGAANDCTTFFQLPAPIDEQVYTWYGGQFESHKNGKTLDTILFNEKWGRQAMVEALVEVLQEWHEHSGDTIRVNDLSYYLGGASSEHKTHRYGRDVDLRSWIVGAIEVQGQPNNRYDHDQTAAFIDLALQKGFNRHCTFDAKLQKRFAGDKRGRVKVVSGHQHHLHMGFGY